MGIHFWSGTYGFSYPDYSKNLTNSQAQPEAEKQQEKIAAAQPVQEQPIELSPLRVNTRVTLGDPLADHQSFQTLDMRKAISDMQQDSVLAKYQHISSVTRRRSHRNSIWMLHRWSRCRHSSPVPA